MVLERSKLGGWATNEKVTSEQLNELDTNLENAIDKRSGETDTVQSDLTFEGESTFDGETTFSDAVTFDAQVNLNGSTVAPSGSSIVVQSGATLTVASGATTSIAGATITGGSVGAASGIATLGSDTKLTAAQRSGWLVSAGAVSISGGNFLTSSTSFVNVTGLSISASCTAGDILIIDANIFASADGISYLKLVIDDGGDVAVGQTLTMGSNSNLDVKSLGWAHTVVNSGTVTARIQAAVFSGGVSLNVGANASTSLGQSMIRMQQFRP